MQISTVIGKQVLSPQGEKLGYVINAYPARDMKSLAALQCADEDEEEYFLPAKNVVSYGDALIANKARQNTANGIASPVGNAVYSHTGELLGAVDDLLLGDGGEALFIVHRDGTKNAYPFSRVSVGDTLIVYPEGVKKPAPKPERKPAGKKPQSRVQAARETEPKPAEPQQSAPKPEPPAQPDPPAQPAPQADGGINRVNLLGRKVKKSVYDDFGYPIAVAGETVTPYTVAAARRSNRLLQLTVNTLTNVV